LAIAHDQIVQADLTPLLPWSIQTIPSAIQHFVDTFKAR
jgi:hypothetical protein